MAIKLTRQETDDLNALAAILGRSGLSAVRTFETLDTKTLERGTRIKEWGRMARGGLGLGYGGGTLGDGKPGDDHMTAEDLDRISAIIDQMPARTAAVLVHMYQLSDEPNASATAIKLGTSRGVAEDCRDQGLNIIYGATCLRIRMRSKTG